MITALNVKGDVVDGTVAKVNDRGLLLAGESTWLNVSRYAQPAPTLPRQGDRVRLYLDGQGYIRDVERIPYEVEECQPDPMGSKAPADRDVRIMRQAVLNTATTIASSGGQRCEADEVIRLADRLERWVQRAD